MTSADVSITPNFLQWADVFDSLGQIATNEARSVWEEFGQAFFDRTQEYAHVITGEMKASGHLDVGGEGLETSIEVHYDAEYTKYELARGGSHDFMTRGWQASRADFEQAMPRIWTAVQAHWR